MLRKLVFFRYNHVKEIYSKKYANTAFIQKINAKSCKSNCLKLLYMAMAFPVISQIMSAFQLLLLLILSQGSVPQHLSFIMDGNRRYAKGIDHPAKTGHEVGSVTLVEMIYYCRMLGVQSLSVYAFSIENFNRSQREVSLLMDLLVAKLTEFNERSKSPLLQDKFFQNCQIKVVGDKSYFDADLRARLETCENGSDSFDADSIHKKPHFIIYICCPYTSKNDIYHAMVKNIKAQPEMDANLEQITKESVTNAMFLGNSSNKCDLLIRTSGQTRFSDYMTWQVHENGSVVFTNTLWPNFGFFELFAIILKWSYYKNYEVWNAKKPTGTFHMPLHLQKNVHQSHPFTHACLQKVFSLNDMMNLPQLKKSSIWQKRETSIEDLPEPPISLSVIDRNH